MPFSSKILAWYKNNGRSLPWRNTQDPYRILVSEIMLQQTQVERVKLFYRSWLKQFPAWKHLARATNEEVIRAWAGLGYNRRALVLRDAARHVVQHGIPSTQKEWLAIKGIGPYTSSALSIFSLRQRVLPIDTNIRRVLGRFLLGVPFPQLANDLQIEKNIDLILPKRGNFYDVPQALFDLATSICTKSPDCSQCPLVKECRSSSAFLSGNVLIPKQMIKKAIESRHAEKPYPDRIYRGRILKLVRESTHGIHPDHVGSHIDATYDPIADSAWVEAMIQRMIKDELIEEQSQKIILKK